MVVLVTAAVVMVTVVMVTVVMVTVGLVTVGLVTVGMVMDTAVTDISELDWDTAAMVTVVMPLTRLGMPPFIPDTTVADTLPPGASSAQEFIARIPVVAGD